MKPGFNTEIERQRRDAGEFADFNGDFDRHTGEFKYTCGKCGRSMEYSFPLCEDCQEARKKLSQQG